ncbi:hypothetical protein [Undibacterium baiyunense]|uniref:Uncharacterized protein n=1 Tax=Undibacterium baiyunense TaxID=2828731 RepID=A0A941I2N0_9BURK|nr:hypothetical protein [Undibacterium baiyunense]MBR7746105.1 hypothetical protein [Undibacterium baiyunense]
MTRIIIILLCALGIAYYTVQIYTLKDNISLTGSAPKSTATNTAEATKPATAPSKPSANEPAQATEQAKKMQFEFVMDSTDIKLIEGCRQLFLDNDKLQLQIDPKQSNKAILRAQRDFDSKDLEDTLAFRRKLRDTGCLQKDSDVFAIKVIQ